MKLKMLNIAAGLLGGSIAMTGPSAVAQAQGGEGPPGALGRQALGHNAAPAAQPRKGAGSTLTPTPTSARVTAAQAPTSTPAVAPQPLRLAQMPAVAPRISYVDGKLTVIAENSTLGDVLNSIHNATGMQIESSGGSSNERVAAKIGPGTVREVLLAVLEGSRYDYILLGSENNPENISKVILTPKSSATGVNTAVGAAPARPADEDAEEENAEGSPRPQPPSETPAPGPAQSGTAPAQTVKTPEQLLEDLRR